MAKNPFISTRFFVPAEWVTEDVKRIELTVHPIHRGRDDEPRRPPVILYDDESYPGYIGLPIDWGVRTFGLREGVTIEDRTVMGGALDMPRRADPYHPNVLDPEAQKQFMKDVLDAMADDFAVMAIAGTGTGKTVVGLDTAAELGRQTLVVVDRWDGIGVQWKDTAIDIFGMDPKDIAIIRGPKCDFTKPLAIALVQSLVRREYPPEFYHAYGTVIWDEVQSMGSDRFQHSLGLFPSSYKLALTATKDRKDGCQQVYLKHFGQGQVVSEAETLPCKVHVIRYTTHNKVWSEEHSEHIKFLAADQRRNATIVGIIKMLFGHDRQQLWVGDSVEHIEAIIWLLKEAGIPANEIGQFTSEYTDDDGNRVKTSSDYLKWVREQPRVILGTYGMVEKGTDIARLDAGGELTPRTGATQLLGRVRRPLPGKPLPLWYTLCDTKIGSLLGMYYARLKDYRKDANIEVVDPNAKQTYAK